MKICTGEKPFFQGDLAIIPNVRVPNDAVEDKAPENGEYVMAHSEDGHHHVLLAKHARVYRVASAMLLYAKIVETTKLLHKKAVDGHESYQLPPGDYLFLRQREGAPEGWRSALD